jgi:RNA-directed DNA polymerase
MELYEGKMTETLSSGSVYTKLERIAVLSKARPERVFTSLSHVIDEEFLHEAYRRTRKDGASGVDGQTAQEYAQELQSNLRSLHERLRVGSYRAPAVRRVHIPKGEGKTRPIGIPTFEDKVLQRSVAMVLTAVYEQDFMESSYGFRPGRSAHDALEALWQGLMEMGGGWVLEVDIERFFDTLDHGQLRSFLDRRVRDGVLRRTIDKWLKAGVLEDGVKLQPDAGTPQGGVISPLLANVYLHEVLDVWFEQEVRPRLSGRSFLIRYADDFVIVLEREHDAVRVNDVLPKRMAKYGLCLHPSKTRLVRFDKPSGNAPMSDSQRPGSFELLGFVHHWTRSRYGQWVVRRKTSSRRLGRALQGVRLWCRAHRHQTVAEQHAALSRKLRGHYSYFGITGNARALDAFYREVRRVWQKWLHRRSNKARMYWQRFAALLQRYPLPQPTVVHSIYRN